MAKLMKELEASLFQLYKAEIVALLTSDGFDEEDDKGKPCSTEDAEEIVKILQKDINTIIQEMIKVYKEDNDLKSLKKPQLDWIREFLYDDEKGMYDLLIELRK